MPGATRHQALAVIAQEALDGRRGGRARDIAQRPHQPQADRRIADGIMPDLLEGEFQQALEMNQGTTTRSTCGGS